MKTFAFAVGLLACVSTAAAAACGAAPCQETCDYDYTLSGKPDCTQYSEGAEFPNTRDPTKYWQCQNGEAVCQSCRTEFLFQADGNGSGQCVCLNEWTWQPPCDPEHKAAVDTGCGDIVGCPSASCSGTSTNVVAPSSNTMKVNRPAVKPAPSANKVVKTASNTKTGCGCGNRRQ